MDTDNGGAGTCRTGSAALLLLGYGLVFAIVGTLLTVRRDIS